METEPLTVVALACAALSTVLVLWYLLRRPLLNRSTKIVLLFAIGLFPLGTAMTGNYAGFEATKERRFCGSCHVMTPIVADLTKEGDTLAATHYQRGLVSHEQACFVCHSGYGIWGTLDAKLAGVRHMMKTATRSYTFPIEHHGPFDIDSCLNCHAQAATFRAVDAHKDPDTQQALYKREMGCTGVCHLAAHPEEALKGPAS